MDLPWEGGGEFPWRRLFFGPPDEVYMKRKPRGAVALAGVLLGALIAVPASGQDVDALIDAELNRLEQARRNQAQINQIAEQTRQRFDEYQILVRSEEHTSELQSRENLVCRLLLEKKKSHGPT